MAWIVLRPTPCVTDGDLVREDVTRIDLVVANHRLRNHQPPRSVRLQDGPERDETVGDRFDDVSNPCSCCNGVTDFRDGASVHDGPRGKAESSKDSERDQSFVHC